jgi:hypothetical protein
MSFLRLLAASEDGAAPDEGTQELHIPPISRRTESMALAALADACERALGAFDTTVADDEALLLEAGLCANLRNAIIMRRGEKKVLHGYLQIARAGMKFVQHRRARRSELVNTLPAGPCAAYLNTLHHGLPD